MIVQKILEPIPVNQIFNIVELYNQISSEISKNAFNKMIERLVKSGNLIRLMKGIYYKPKIGEFGVVPILESSIVNYYVAEGKGMVVGYNLLLRKGLTTQISKNIEVLSNFLQNNRKHVANICVNRVNLYFSESTVAMMEVLEILQCLHTVEDIDYCALSKYLREVAEKYSQEEIDKILENRKYRKSTLAMLKSILNYYGVANTLQSHLSTFSHYKMLDMEKIYASA